MSSVSKHLQYLDAMGIQVWQERVSPDESIIDDVNAVLGAQAIDQHHVSPGECQRGVGSQLREPLVFASGALDADWFIIGDIPSAQNEEHRRPFAGVEGRLLTDILHAMDVNNVNVYQTTSAKCNENHSAVMACRQYLFNQIKQVAPRVVLVFGEKPAQNLLQSTKGINELRGEKHTLDGLSSAVVVSHSLNDLMQFGSLKKQAWQDLQFAKCIF